MKNINSDAQREWYKLKCKHYSYGNCLDRSGSSGGSHFLWGCDGKCNRMKRYDRLKKQTNDAEETDQGSL